MRDRAPPPRAVDPAPRSRAMAALFGLGDRTGADRARTRAAGGDTSLHLRIVRVDEYTRDGPLYAPAAALERSPSRPR